MKRAGAGQPGFTLIELLVGLALTGLIMALIGAALPLGMSGAARTRALSDSTVQLRAVQSLLRRQIGEMPPWLVRDKHSEKLIFSGTSGQMTYPAYPPAAQGGGAVAPVILSVQRINNGDRLVYSATGETRELLVGASQIEFSYFGGAVWRDRWDDPHHLPQLVRIRVLQKPGAPAWPDLLIAPLTQPPPR